MTKHFFLYLHSKLKLLNWLILLKGIVCVLVQPSFAQNNILPDTTLGVDNSRIINDVNNLSREEIVGGAQRGINLFHSFQEFNINEGSSVFFNNPAGIENILGRVTGNNPSTILGTLGVLGDANLFLLNPNGIIFGENASLDINGSFVATSANAIQFGEQGFFSADASESLPLLTINPSAFFFNQMAAGAIQNQSTAGLSVAEGNSLLLLGGDVEINGGRLDALGGQVEIGGLKDSGTVGLNVDGNNLNLSFPNQVLRGDVTLSNQALVNVASDGGGAISIHAQNINLSEGSNLVAGIAPGLGTPDAQAGDINLNATEIVSLSQGSIVQNQVNENSIGNSGNIRINTSSLSISDASVITSDIVGTGDGGLVSINATDNVDLSGANTFVFSNILATGQGKAGGIEIKTSSLSLSDGAVISSSVFGTGDDGGIEIKTSSLSLSDDSVIANIVPGKGDGGLISINATETIELSRSARIFSDVSGQGNTEGIAIKTSSLTLNAGTSIASLVSGTGNGGLVSINATETIELSGANIISDVNPSAEGNTEGIEIKTRSLTLSDGTRISSDVFGKGNGGLISIDATEIIDLSGANTFIFSNVNPSGEGNTEGIEIKTSSLTLSDGARIASAVEGKGDGGLVSINATEIIELSGTNTRIATDINPSAEGNTEGIEIKTGSLSVNDGAIISSLISGTGDGGLISISAKEKIELSGTNTAIFSDINRVAEGNTGGIEINTSSLSLSNDARISSSVVGKGEAGLVSINATDKVELSGINTFILSVLENADSTAQSKTEGIEIKTGSLSLSDGALISSSVVGKGDGGLISINATDKVELSGTNTVIFSDVNETAQGNGGDININTGSFALTNFAEINSDHRSAQEGNAGDIVITAENDIFISEGEIGNASINIGNAGNIVLTANKISTELDSSINSSNDGDGNSGNILLQANSIALIDPVINSQIKGKGQAGNIDIIAEDSLLIRGEENLAPTVSIETFGSSQGGNINLQGKAISIERGVVLNAISQGEGNGGNINIKANQFQLENARIDSSALGRGNAGNIDISVTNVNLSNQGIIAVSSQSQGNAGKISINTNSLTLENSSQLLATTESSEGGNIELEIADLLLLRNNSSISTTAGRDGAGGNGGNIDIDANFLLAFPTENNDITANAFDGSGGNIEISTAGIFGLEERSSTPANETNDIDASSELGLDGKVTLNQLDIDPAQGLEELPTEIIDVTRLVAQGCPAGNRGTNTGNQFTITGRGGLPPQPEDTLRIPAIIVGDDILAIEKQKPSPKITFKPILEANSWIINAQGKVILTASTSSRMADSYWSNLAKCPDH